MDRDSRKAVVGILAGSGDDCELSSSVDQIHSGNLVVFVPFRNAMPADPKVPEAQGFCVLSPHPGQPWAKAMSPMVAGLGRPTHS